VSADDDYAEDMRDWYGEDDPVDGVDLLDDLLATIKKYVVLDDHAAAASTLWTAATHALPAFECAPRLVFTSPEKRCGKTRVLDIVAGISHDPLATSDATVAAIFRSIGDGHPPTLIIDEADAIFGTKKVAEQNEDLRKLLNAGHQRGRPAIRCVGPLQIPTKFSVFAMAALAGIGTMPDTITDRAVNITMRRRASGEKVSQFRSRRDAPALGAIRERLSKWAADHIEGLSAAVPKMPVEDRAADTWEPLIAIADAAGGHWPATARAACKALVAAADSADEDRSLAVKLLVDIHQVFTEKGLPFLASAELVAELRGIEESPWNEFDLNASKLAYRLREFGVRPGRNTAGNLRGYALEWFRDAFERYTRQNPSEPSETASGQGQPSDGSKASDGSECQTDGLPVRPSERRQTETAGQTLFSDGLTGSDTPPARNGQPPLCGCGNEMVAPQSIARGQCERCHLASKREARP